MKAKCMVVLSVILSHTAILSADAGNLASDTSWSFFVTLTEELAGDWERLNAKEYMDHFSHDVDFYFGGNRMGYEELESNVRLSVDVLAESTFEVLDPKVSLIGNNHGVISFELKETFLDKKGNYEELEAAMTLVWTRKGDDWKVVLAHESLSRASVPSE